MKTPALTLRHVSKSYAGFGKGRVIALHDISLEIQQGEFFVCVGPSGCGKSTLLRIMTGLDRDYEGKVILGKGLSRANMSFVFQQFALLPWMNVYQNVELGLLARGVDPAKRRKLVLKELATFGLEKFAHAFPRELSGGMKQRVGIARALVTSPKVIFLDEAFSELDSFTAETLRKELLSIWLERRPTIVMVTHIVAEALELGDRIASLTPRPGHLEEIVVNTLPRPRNLRTKEFFMLEDRVTALVAP